MQQRRTASSNNPGSLPLTSQDLSNKKQSHRSRLRRGGNLKRNNRNNFIVGLMTVFVLIVSCLSIFYFVFHSPSGSHEQRARGKEMLNKLSKFSKSRQRLDPREPYRQNEHPRRRIQPEDEWKHFHADNEEFENRHHMMHFRPDMNADVNIDRDEMIKKEHSREKFKDPKEFLNQVRDKINVKSDDSTPSMEYLETVPIVSKLLTKVNFVGFYFASSWCPTSQPATDTLQSTFSQSDKLLLPSNVDTEQQKELAIVYISSDRSQSEMDDYLTKHNWMIPLTNTNKDDVSSTIKRMFHTCAWEEVPNIDSMERNYGIPRLVILDSSRNVITTDGINDVINDGVDAIKRWVDLKKVKDLSVGGGDGDRPNIVIH